jgi:DNA modification methylase
MVAFALQADGWYLRSDIVWAKSNPMPESVTDRPTKAHEYLFLLAKSHRYFYDADAIREDWADDRKGWPGPYVRGEVGGWRRGDGTLREDTGFAQPPAVTGRGKRSVWTVATQQFAGAHFAVFPPKLIEPCILAGSSPRACGKCGAPWVRMTRRERTRD